MTDPSTFPAYIGLPLSACLFVLWGYMDRIVAHVNRRRASTTRKKK